MKWANNFDPAKHTTAIAIIVFLAASDMTFCLVAATIPTKAREATCRTTSRALRPLCAALQLRQFTTWDQYLKDSSKFSRKLSYSNWNAESPFVDETIITCPSAVLWEELGEEPHCTCLSNQLHHQHTCLTIFWNQPQGHPILLAQNKPFASLQGQHPWSCAPAQRIVVRQCELSAGSTF